MGYRSVIMYISGFFVSYVIAMISAITESIPFMAVAFIVFGIYIMISVYFARKYRVR